MREGVQQGEGPRTCAFLLLGPLSAVTMSVVSVDDFLFTSGLDFPDGFNPSFHDTVDVTMYHLIPQSFHFVDQGDHLVANNQTSINIFSKMNSF